MNTIKIVVTFALMLAGLVRSHAQLQTSAVQVIEEPPLLSPLALPLVEAGEVPETGNFFSVQRTDFPPLPFCPFPDLPVYDLGNGEFIYDDRTVDYQALEQQRLTETALLRATAESLGMSAAAMTAAGIPLDSGGFGMMSALVQNPDGLWLEITNVSGGQAYVNLHNATNQVYEIWSKTDLAAASWDIETELWPDPNQTVAPFTVAQGDRSDLFLWARDWTGIDENTNGIPDWWEWQYFGTTSVAVTNLDYSGDGYTFAEDYSNNIPPTVFKFTGVEVTNHYVSSSSAAVQLDVTGYPYYAAILLDDGNFSNAVWNAYASANVTVNLGLAEGWHAVWIGLRGHADDASAAVWQRKRLKLDWTPPALIITGPTNGTVDVPMIQLSGYSPEALSSINYDLSNAAGTVTNQPILVLNQYYDTTTWEFTTNTWQAFDVVLTNGVNTFIFHATDLAGNVTTLVTNFTLDYSAKTNPPSVQITWPQNGAEISGGTFTVDGQASDPTVTIAATITDSNGATNTVNGLVERTGKFWVENLPLNSGTNTVTLIVSDAAGNVNTNSFNVVQSAVTLTMDPVTPDSQLWQPTVNLTGTISDATYAVWVNGVKGHNNGNGTWSANNVPVNSGGTASFAVTGYAPNEQQPDGTYGN